MKKFEKIVTVYTLGNDFTAEVEKNGDLKDFYLVNKSIGDKMHMFGLPNCSEDDEEDIIRSNAQDYIELFFEIYGEN